MPIVGIYAIENSVTGDRYIGSSVDIQRRGLAHLASLRRGCHENRHLQNAWNKFGEESFLVGVVEECETDELFEVEAELIEMQGHYNICRVAGRPPSRKGQTNSPEHREKCSIANRKPRGPNSPERNARISAAQKGRKMSLEFCARMALALRGRKATPQHRANISAALTGRVLSDEHKASLSRARRRTIARKAVHG